MSPVSRGRPASRGGSRRKPQLRRQKPASCWFDEPDLADPWSWAFPAAHGTYDEMELADLDPRKEDDRELLIEARHPEYWAALKSGRDTVTGGHAVNPRLHVISHLVVLNQVVDGNPPETWATVQRLAGLGYDWHNIVHMIGGLVMESMHRAQVDLLPFDRELYSRELDALPGDWPPP